MRVFPLTFLKNHIGHVSFFFYRFMVFNATFNNILVTIVYRRGGQFLLVEETRVPGENH
jgi:hypothetical protein